MAKSTKISAQNQPLGPVKKAEILQKIQANNLKILELNRQNQQLANQL